MTDLPKNVLAWFPEGASPSQAVGLFVRLGAQPKSLFQYRELLADRVQWLLENSDPEDFRLANDLLLEHGLLREPALEPEELVQAVRAGQFDQRLRVLGVNPPLRGRSLPPADLKEVFLLEWASSMVPSEPDDQPPPRR